MPGGTVWLLSICCLQALTLLDYLLKTGSERVAQQCRENAFTIQVHKHERATAYNSQALQLLVRCLKFTLHSESLQIYCLFLGADAARLPVRGPRRQRPGGQCERKSPPAGVPAPRRGAAAPGEEPGPEDQGANGRRRRRRRRRRQRRWRGRVRRHTPILPPGQTNEPAQHGGAVRRGVQPLQRLTVLL